MLVTDVLVVGMGPGGGAAAQAAAAGARVVAIDKKRHIGLPVQCAEFVPAALLTNNPPYRGERWPIGHMRSRLPSGAETWTRDPGYLLRRDEFDRSLADAAVAAGALLWTATSLVSVDTTERVATVSYNGTHRQIRYEVLIAADGPASRVAACTGDMPLQRIAAHQYRLPLQGESHDTEVWLDHRYPGGYAWLFPRRDTANVGVGFWPRERGDVAVELAVLRARLMAEGRVGREILAHTGGWIPVSGLRDRLSVGRVLFVGDAGGFTHPITGAGIAPAVQSGQCAGEAAAAFVAGQGQALAAYEEEMRDVFDASRARAVARRMAWLTGRVCDDAALRGAWVAFDEYWS